MKHKPMSEERLQILRRNIQSAKLGKARRALKRISEYRMDQYEDYDDAYIHIKYIATTALSEMENVLKDKKSQRLKNSMKGEK